MRRNRPNLGSYLLFAACAGVFALLWAPLFGYGGTAGPCALALVVLHPLFVAPTVQRGGAATALAFALAVPVALRFGPFTAFAWMAFLLGIVRSLVLYPQPFPRAFVTEAGLGCAGLLALLYFHDGSRAGTAFGLWSFWLVQAIFCLVPAESDTPPDGQLADPFERAQAAALQVLDRRR